MPSDNKDSRIQHEICLKEVQSVLLGRFFFLLCWKFVKTFQQYFFSERCVNEFWKKRRKKKASCLTYFQNLIKVFIKKKSVLFIILIMIWIIKISDFAFETHSIDLFFYKLIQHTVTSDTQRFNIKKCQKKSKVWKWSLHVTTFHCVITVSLHLLVKFVKSFSIEHVTCRNNQAWSGLEHCSALECLGCGVMMSTSANAVQFTLGAKCEHVCVTLWKWDWRGL